MNRDRAYFLLLNVGHFLDHLFTLIFATVAAPHSCVMAPGSLHLRPKAKGRRRVGRSGATGGK